MVHKIALNGFGRIGELLYAGADSVTAASIIPQHSNLTVDLSFLTYKINSKMLVDSYRKVQHKYYPEKDVYKG